MSIIVQTQFFKPADFASAHAFANALCRLGPGSKDNFAADITLFEGQPGYKGKLRDILDTFNKAFNAGVIFNLIHKDLLRNILFHTSDEEINLLGSNLGLCCPVTASVGGLFTYKNGSWCAAFPSLFRINDNNLSHGALKFLEGTEEITLSRASDVLLHDISISRNQGKIVRVGEGNEFQLCLGEGSRAKITPAGSPNPVFGNRTLHHGDIIKLGELDFIFLLPGYPIAQSLSLFSSAKAA